MTTRRCYRGGRVHSPADPRATALLVDGRRASPGSATTTPDAPATRRPGRRARRRAGHPGLRRRARARHRHRAGADRARPRPAAQSLAEALDAVAALRRSAGRGAVVLGHGWDETALARAAAADPRRARPGRRRAGRSTCPASTSTRRSCPPRCSRRRRRSRAAPATTPSGLLARDAHHAVRAAALGAVDAGRSGRPRSGRRCDACAALGIGAVHECGGPDISGAGRLRRRCWRWPPPSAGPRGRRLLGRAAGGGVERARELGALGAGGRPVRRRRARLAHRVRARAVRRRRDRRARCTSTAEQVARPRRRPAPEPACRPASTPSATRAIDAVVAGFAAAAAIVGLGRGRPGARHRIEHVEMVDADADRAARASSASSASVQPVVRRALGRRRPACTPQRLGVDRALTLNPFAALRGAGVPLASARTPR